MTQELQWNLHWKNLFGGERLLDLRGMPSGGALQELRRRSGCLQIS